MHFTKVLVALHPPPPGEGENVNTTAAISKFPELSIINSPTLSIPSPCFGQTGAKAWSGRAEVVDSWRQSEKPLIRS